MQDHNFPVPPPLLEINFDEPLVVFIGIPGIKGDLKKWQTYYEKLEEALKPFNVAVESPPEWEYHLYGVYSPESHSMFFTNQVSGTIFNSTASLWNCPIHWLKMSEFLTLLKHTPLPEAAGEKEAEKRAFSPS